jgi:RNase P subunit RPR2
MKDYIADRLRLWLGKTTDKPQCPYCFSTLIIRKDEIAKKGERKGKIARLQFTCDHCGATNIFSNPNLIDKEVTE